MLARPRRPSYAIRQARHRPELIAVPLNIVLTRPRLS